MTTDVALALKITNSFKPPHSTHLRTRFESVKAVSFASILLQTKPKAANPVPGGAARGTHAGF